MIRYFFKRNLFIANVCSDFDSEQDLSVTRNAVEKIYKCFNKIRCSGDFCSFSINHIGIELKRYVLETHFNPPEFTDLKDELNKLAQGTKYINEWEDYKEE